MGNKRIRDKKHLKRICEDGCMICGGEAIPHHLLRSGSHGGSLKAPDTEAVPLCPAHHDELHRNGNEVAFFEDYAIPYAEVLEYVAELWKETLTLRGK